MEKNNDKTGRTIAALFFSSTFFLFILAGFDESAYVRAEAALQSVSIAPVYSVGDSAVGEILFVAHMALPFVFSVLYAFGVKWTSWFFIVSFIAYVFSPIFMNAEGVEVYTSIDILADAVVGALGGMLCLQIATFEGIVPAARRDQVDAGS